MVERNEQEAVIFARGDETSEEVNYTVNLGRVGFLSPRIQYIFFLVTFNCGDFIVQYVSLTHIEPVQMGHRE